MGFHKSFFKERPFGGLNYWISFKKGLPACGAKRVFKKLGEILAKKNTLG